MLTYRIMQMMGGIWHDMTITMACCLFCGSDELVVSDVEREGCEPEEWPSAVCCGSCGACGPWGTTEYRAVEAWNTAGGVETKPLVGWQPIPMHAGPWGDDGECPF